MLLKNLIKELQKLDGNLKVSLYAGQAKEFTSDYGWETTFEDYDSKRLQLFLNVSCKGNNSVFKSLGEKALKISDKVNNQ